MVPVTKELRTIDDGDDGLEVVEGSSGIDTLVPNVESSLTQNAVEGCMGGSFEKKVDGVTVFEVDLSEAYDSSSAKQIALEALKERGYMDDRYLVSGCSESDPFVKEEMPIWCLEGSVLCEEEGGDALGYVFDCDSGGLALAVYDRNKMAPYEGSGEPYEDVFDQYIPAAEGKNPLVCRFHFVNFGE